MSVGTFFADLGTFIGRLFSVQTLDSRAQATIDEIAARAQHRPAAHTRAESILTTEDIRILEALYMVMGQAGRISFPEAAQLMRRYLDTEASGVESVASTIYEESPNVQREMSKQRDELLVAAKAGRLKDDGTSVYSINASAKLSEGCSHEGKKPPQSRMVTADGERLMKANNRFWIQSYSVRSAASVTTTFEVTDCYEFEPFAKGLFTTITFGDQQVKLPDGNLSEYLTRVGIAKVFEYDSSWVQTWALALP